MHAKGTHAFSKDTLPRITLLAGLGVEGDAHCGATVKHRSRVARNPHQPNLRQVHLLHQELLDELAGRGLPVAPGQMGENITTAGLALLDLSEGTVLRIGEQALVRITGLRNPCAQIESFRPGLLAAVLDRGADGALIRKAGVMGVVLRSGPVAPGDALAIVSGPPLHKALQPV
nr:MOSC domain-containing protein [Pseudorhodoferax sp.]